MPLSVHDRRCGLQHCAGASVRHGVAITALAEGVSSPRTPIGATCEDLRYMMNAPLRIVTQRTGGGSDVRLRSRYLIWHASTAGGLSRHLQLQGRRAADRLGEHSTSCRARMVGLGIEATPCRRNRGGIKPRAPHTHVTSRHQHWHCKGGIKTFLAVRVHLTPCGSSYVLFFVYYS